MTDPTSRFDLEEFLPYLLNQAAEATSHGFQAVYREQYGFTRTQWRVLANLGKFGAMTARDICTISHIEKTKVSRAVAALEHGKMLSRTPSKTDRRAEVLSLTETGHTAFEDLGLKAVAFDQALREQLGSDAAGELNRLLLTIIAARSNKTAAS
jgi:DNA-binding MarR family transcriptional regulator